MPDRWSQWGGTNLFTARVDYTWNERVLAMQTALLRAISAPALLSRVRESESRAPDAYRLAEHFDRVTRSLWGEVGGVSAVAR